MTTVFFHNMGSGQAHAADVSLAVVFAITVICCGLVWLLPRRGQPEEY